MHCVYGGRACAWHVYVEVCSSLINLLSIEVYSLQASIVGREQLRDSNTNSEFRKERKEFQFRCYCYRLFTSTRNAVPFFEIAKHFWNKNSSYGGRTEVWMFWKQHFYFISRSLKPVKRFDLFGFWILYISYVSWAVKLSYHQACFSSIQHEIQLNCLSFVLKCNLEKNKIVMQRRQ